MHVLVAFVLTILPLGLLVWRAANGRHHSKNLPPGPPADPIIGHVRKVPASRPELAYHQWAQEYKSDVIHVNMMGQHIVVLNSAQSAIDLLDKRSKIYSDRPGFDLFKESGWSDALTFTGMGPEFRMHRKMFQNTFAPANALVYRPRQQQLARSLAERLIHNPSDWESQVIRYATSVTLSIAYGLTDLGDDSPYVKLASKVAWIFGNGGPPGQTMVDVLPIIRRLPHWVTIFPSLNFARQTSYPIIREFIERPFAFVKKTMAEGRPSTSFSRKMLEEIRDAKPSRDSTTADVTEDAIKGAASTVYAAGTDTMFATIIIFILNMIRHPEVQEKAQRELDDTIGRDRLPAFDDQPNLPYLSRVFKETARWHPTVPLGIPHKLSADDVYKDMFLPKNSFVMFNAYAMTHDPALYKDPDVFNPDRYIPKSEGGPGEPFPTGQFGFGRRGQFAVYLQRTQKVQISIHSYLSNTNLAHRICPGQHIGSASVWIAMATLLATVNIKRAKDSGGKEIIPNPKMTTGLESHPEPFPCVFGPRDDLAVKLLDDAAE